MSRVPRELRSDGQATRSRILEAAGELFAVGGYAETTGKSIAERAGVTLAAINYHFGSRDGLYQAVLVEAHRRIIDVADLESLAQGEAAAEAKLGIVIEHMVRQITKRRPGWHLRVLTREVLAPSSHIRILIQSALPPKVKILKAILGDIAGIPVDDPALVPCYISVFAPLLLLLVGPRPGPKPLFDARHAPWNAIAAHMHRFAVAGLEAVGRDRRAAMTIRL
jgi:AcrR family transcriptional regulator